MLLWLIAFLGLCGIGLALSYRAYMNYQGYCWKEGRYLTEQEKIYRSILGILREYPPAVIPVETYETNNGDVARKTISIEEIKKKKWWGQTPPERPLAYNNVDDFLRNNPNCCQIRGDQNFHKTSEFGVPSLFDLVTDTESSYVRVRYWVRYIDDGKEKRLQTNYYAGLSNCGKPSWHSNVPSYIEDLSNK